MKKIKIGSVILGVITAAIIMTIGLIGFCVSINVHEVGFWILIVIALFVAIALARISSGIKDFGNVIITKRTGSKGRKKSFTKFNFNIVPYLVPVAILVLVILIGIAGSTIFNSEKYSSILSVEETEFSQDINESVGTDSIALMDTPSAQMLGDREIGSLSSVVSQFNVSDNYTQIDYQGKPIKMSALNYAGFFKWINNKDKGVCGYVTVDPVSMSASYKECDGMKYVPSAYIFEDAYRHVWLKYPTTMFGNAHFEIDENGKPYYIFSTYKMTVALFNGKTVDGCIILDPTTGEATKYALKDVPKWVDMVFPGDMLCEQYNWYGTLQNGYLNSIIGKKGCKQVTSYYSSDEESDDETPTSDYGYVAKDGDIWIYTGITSVNGDSSNIGFLLANERTGEAHYFNIAGADEKSAMAAAEGEVQEKGYQASFPSLINIDGNSTYIMVLKDAGGLVKLYAAVNVEQYNLVTTATTQAGCLAKYRELLGIEEPEDTTQKDIVTITVADIKYIDIDGNTYIYLIDNKNNIYKAKASSNEQLLLVKTGDKLELELNANKITAFKIIK